MGGDHKCPVCQATFTRPQHVARHMRSHTGDRPYKCQYCGDQFARSDLLSRHVNKCHANEKPLPTTGTRRKGTASASRATTSKQACDQCVQSSLPCDGCNPCSKCVQRKCRCTFVKFHRQTAPAGPGHNTRPSVPTSASGLTPLHSASSSRVPIFPQQPEDDFILGPSPTSSSGVSTMAETLYNSNSFSFPPLYPTEGIGSDTTDYTSKYRAEAQAELFGPGRSGLGTGLTPLYDPRASSSASTASGSTGWLGWDQQQQPQQDPNVPGDTYHRQEHGRRQDMMHASNTDAPSSSTMHDKRLQQQLHQEQDPQHYMNLNMSMPYPISYGSASASAPGSDYGGSGEARRRGSITSDLEVVNDFGGNEYSGSDGSHSIPSSAASSSVHLPLGMYQHQHQQQQHLPNQRHHPQHAQQHGMYNNAGHNIGLNLDRAATASTSTTSSSSSHAHHARASSYGGGPNEGAGGYPPQDERQEFSSAFGLMSLDDPNVIAGIAADGQPFFSDPAHAHNQLHGDSVEGGNAGDGGDGDMGMGAGNGGGMMVGDMDTPMPTKRLSGILSPSMEGGLALRNGNALPTPSKDADAREMREFWKQYMRTPLSGPGPVVGLVDSTFNNKVSSPFRRPRVASLPIVKTPMVERDNTFDTLGGGGHYHQKGDATATGKVGPMSSLRTTLHGNQEDLRSYEAAVMARKAPTTLNLQPKKPKGKGSNGAPAGNFGTRTRSAVDLAGSAATGSRSSTSSLANAFGGPGGSSNSQQPPPPSAPAGRMAFSVKEEGTCTSLTNSRNSSAGVDDYSSGGHPASDQESSRPSFKRLPSQTLGPAHAKRPFYGFGVGEDDTKNRALVGWGNAPAEPGLAGATHVKKSSNKNTSTHVNGLAGISHPDRVVATLAERRSRRMSAPGSSLGLQQRNEDQGQEAQKISDRQPYALDVSGPAYAPAALGN